MQNRLRPRRATRALTVVLALTAMLALSGCEELTSKAATLSKLLGSGGSAVSAESGAISPQIDVPKIRALLDTLPVKGRAPKTGYTRGEFGTAWTDANTTASGGNGCDTRNDILARDLTKVTFKDKKKCLVASGTLNDPYTGKIIEFVRSGPGHPNSSSEVQIDHVVALSNAWQTGAQQLTVAQRTNIANDPRNLLAVDGPANNQKSDGDAATWLPSNKGFRCAYVARQIQVKSIYGLWVTPAEHDAMTRILAHC